MVYSRPHPDEKNYPRDLREMCDFVRLLICEVRIIRISSIRDFYIARIRPEYRIR